MQNKSILIGVVVAALIIFGAGGYYFGTRSSNQGGSQNAYSGSNAGPAVVGTPVNHSTIIADLKTKLNEDPNDVAILTRLGDIYFDLKQFTQAVDYYKKVIRLKPDDADVYNDIGLSMHYLGDSAGGLKYIEDGLKKNPYHQRIWLTKGFILAYGMGDLDAARQAWEKTRALNPESRVGKAASEYLAQIPKK